MIEQCCNIPFDILKVCQLDRGSSDNLKTFCFGTFGLHTSLSWLFMQFTKIYWTPNMREVWEFSGKYRNAPCLLGNYILVRLYNLCIHLAFWYRIPEISKILSCKNRVWKPPRMNVYLFENDEDNSRQLFLYSFLFCYDIWKSGDNSEILNWHFIILT